jgi:hypothetical protein
LKEDAVDFFHPLDGMATDADGRRTKKENPILLQ